MVIFPQGSGCSFVLKRNFEVEVWGNVKAHFIVDDHFSDGCITIFLVQFLATSRSSSTLVVKLSAYACGMIAFPFNVLFYSCPWLLFPILPKQTQVSPSAWRQCKRLGKRCGGSLGAARKHMGIMWKAKHLVRSIVCPRKCLKGTLTKFYF